MAQQKNWLEERVFLGLGSNLGDRVAHLRKALEMLESSGFSCSRASEIYTTPPWGLKEQPVFLNQVIEGHFASGPRDLLELALGIEAEMGRERTLHWGPRILDLDILAYGQYKIHSQRLTIPHPYIAERAFVLVPWAEIAPEFVPPGAEARVDELLQRLSHEEIEGVKVFGTGD